MTTYSATLIIINLIFVSSPSFVESCVTVPTITNSDHNGIDLITSLKSPKRREKTTHRKYQLALLTI